MGEDAEARAELEDIRDKLIAEDIRRKAEEWRRFKIQRERFDMIIQGIRKEKDEAGEKPKEWMRMQEQSLLK
jgi:hypothetical protein